MYMLALTLYVFVDDASYFAPMQRGAKYCDEYDVCLSVHRVHFVACGRGSVLFLRRWDT